MHGTAHWMAFTTLFSGGTVVISTDRRFDPSTLWELIAREHVNFLVIVGDAFARPLVDALDELDDAVDLSGLVVILSGGAILSPTVKHDLAERPPGHDDHRRLRVVRSRRAGPVRHGRGGATQRGPRFRVNDQTTVLTADFTPAPVGVVGKLARRGPHPDRLLQGPREVRRHVPGRRRRALVRPG